MNLYLRYNADTMYRIVLREQLDKFGYRYALNENGSVYFFDKVPECDYKKIHEVVNHYGIEVIDNKKAIMVQKVKAVINEMLDNGNMPLIKISAHLSEKLGESYRSIAQVFTEVCHITVENFIIISKIERVKKLLTSESLSLTEISYKLNYSSVGHLSNQFKNITGLTPSSFQKLAQSRRNFRAIIQT
ncbi:MAG: AraC family transcriptional regulator [Flavobacterium psychrophilum]|nr:MAG: AraC family transcriptional regulator [Flavobacterium psychrophilum]